MKSFYTCSSVNSPSTLLKTGATAHPIWYTYQLDTPLLDGSSDNIAVQEAIGRVQRVLLKSVATRSGLTDCVVVTSQLRDGSSWRKTEEIGGDDEERRRRRLIPKERGSTSIVGLSLLPGDEVDGDATCTSSDTSASNSFWSSEQEERTTSGTVKDESNSSPSSSELFVNDDTLIDVRIDGKIGVRASPLIETRSNTEESNTDSNSNDLAFNFISTQSESLSRNSYTRSHDPLVPVQDLMTTRISKKCTVVQGYMTLYTYDSDSYENLEARTVDAIKEDMEDDTFVKQNFLNDVVLGVRFVGSNITDVEVAKDSVNSSPGYVSSIIGAPANATTGSGTLDMFTFPVMILIALGAILLVLIALFVGTSKTSNRKRKRQDQSFYGDQSSSSLREIRSKDIFDYSRDEYDASTATPSQMGREVKIEYFFNNFLEDVGTTLSRTFSGFSDRAHTHGITGDESVLETYEATIRGDGGVRIQNVTSWVDEDYEDCYSVSSVYDDHEVLPPPPPISPSRRRTLPSPGRMMFTSMKNDEVETETDGLSARDSLRAPTTPSRTKTPRRYPNPSSVLASRSPKHLMQKFSKNHCDGDVTLQDDAFLQDFNPFDESDGVEVSLRPFV